MKFNYNILIICILLFVNSGCESDTQSSEMIIFEQNITNFAKSNHYNEEIQIKIVNFTSFNWDKFYVFTPYTRKENIIESLGVPWPGVNKYDIEKNDSHCLLVFVKGVKVVQSIFLKRKPVDFSNINKFGPYSPNEANFECKRENEPLALRFEVNSK